MILTFTQLVPTSEPDVADYVRAKLARLEIVITIKSAQVTLLRIPSHLPFRATVHLEVPGPDLRADELGHTQMEALDSAFANLKEQSSLCHAGQWEPPRETAVAPARHHQSQRQRCN
jgi:hypothetical protein